MQISNYYLFQKNKSPFFQVRFTYSDGSYSSKSTKQTAEYKARDFAIAEMKNLMMPICLNKNRLYLSRIMSH